MFGKKIGRAARRQGESQSGPADVLVGDEDMNPEGLSAIINPVKKDRVCRLRSWALTAANRKWIAPALFSLKHEECPSL